MSKILVSLLLLGLSTNLFGQEISDSVTVKSVEEKVKEENTAPNRSTEQVSETKKCIGYLSYSQLLKMMPEYAEAQEKLSELQTKYDDELKRSERDFTRRFAEFIEGQKDFPENIMVKRQKELQELMEKSIEFKEEIKKLLNHARKDMLQPVKERLNTLIAEVGNELELEYVLNTDRDTYPFINKTKGIDISELVISKMKN